MCNNYINNNLCHFRYFTAGFTTAWKPDTDSDEENVKIVFRKDYLVTGVTLKGIFIVVISTKIIFFSDLTSYLVPNFLFFFWCAIYIFQKHGRVCKITLIS